MTTFTIPKNEYLKIVENQEKLRKKVDLLQKILKEEIQDEIRPEYARKLDHISADLDKGKGIRFLDAKEAKRYLKNL